VRFCPFCSAENADELAACGTCGRRLPPLPPRRARNAPPTGVQLPPRHVPPASPHVSPASPAGDAPGSPPPVPPRSGSTTSPPPVRSGSTTSPPPVRSGSTTNPPPVRSGSTTNPPPVRSGSTTNPPPVQPTPRAPLPASPPAASHAPQAKALAPAAPLPAAAPRVSSPVEQTGDHTIVSPPDPAIVAEHDRSLLHAISPGPAAQRREAPPDDARDPVHARRRSDAAPQPIPSVTSARARTPSMAPPPAGLAVASAPEQSTARTQAPAMSSPSGPPPRTRPASIPPAIPSAVGASRTKPTTMPPAIPPARPPSVPAAGMSFDDDFNTVTSGERFDTGRNPIVPGGTPTRAPLPPPITPAASEPARPRSPTGVEPPPTRIHRPEALADRPFTPPKVDPVPEIPEPGLIHAAKYAVRFGRARWQRRGAIRTLGADIKQDTEALDQVLGALGRAARGAKVEGRVFSAENAAITAAEERAFMLGQEHDDVDARKAEENSKFVDVERERNAKLGEAEKVVEETQKELAHLEGQRRGMRDKRKELERRQKAYLKAAEDSEKQAGNAQMGDTRQELRRAAEQHRKEAATLEPERQDIDRRLASLERPIGEATARLDAAKAELDAAKRSLADAREGHLHRLAELDAEQKRKAREIALAESEIARRLVTLGTLVNLNRIEDAQFHELYQRIDRLRGAITARTTEIEKLTAEREAYDRGTLVRGISTIGGAIVLFIALIVILRAVV